MIIEQSIDNYHLDRQYTNAYKSKYLQPLKLLRPDLLHFEDAVELNNTMLGKGYLIPLSVNIQKINHSLEIKIFAFFCVKTQQIYQLNALADAIDIKEIVAFLKNGQKKSSLHITINNIEDKSLVNVDCESLVTTQIINERMKTSLNKIKKGAFESLNTCTEENTYYLVRTFYNSNTGEILDQVIIGVFCISSDPDPGTGSGAIYPGDSLELHKAIIKSTCFNTAQMEDFRISFNSWYDEDCINRAIYKDLLEKGLKLDFCLDSNFNGNAYYSPVLKKIMFKNQDMIKNSIVFDEELFHAFQDKSYPGGTQQYYTNARGNIEFEARLNYDISRGWTRKYIFRK